MPILNKILNVLNLLLAIIVCGACFVLYQKRAEFKERDLHLIETIYTSVQTLDGDIGTDYYTQDFKDNLSWENWVKDQAAYKSLTAKTAEQAQGVLQFNAQLSEGILAVAGAIEENPSLQGENRDAVAANLKHINNYKDEVEKLTTFTKDVYTRGENIIAGIVDASQSLDPQNQIKNADDLKVMSGNQYMKPLEKLKSDLSGLVDQRDNYFEGYAKIAEAFDKHDFEADLDALADKDDFEAFKSSLEELITNDFNAINDKLEELEKVETIIIAFRQDIKEKKKTIETLEADFTAQKNRLAIADAKVKGLTKKNDDLVKQIQGITEVEIPRGITANIMEINDQYKFVVLDKGSNHQLKEKAEMLVHRDNQYVCKLKLTRCLPNYSIAEVAFVSQKSMPIAGDSVVAP